MVSLNLNTRRPDAGGFLNWGFLTFMLPSIIHFKKRLALWDDRLEEGKDGLNVHLCLLYLLLKLEHAQPRRRLLVDGLPDLGLGELFRQV